jgi:hypothetical protein
MKKSLIKLGLSLLLVTSLVFGTAAFAGDEAPGPKSIDPINPIEYSVTK